MPPGVKLTKEQIVDAAVSIIREGGLDGLNARAQAQKLHCSTQPILYALATTEDLNRAAFARVDLLHTGCLSEEITNAKAENRRGCFATPILSLSEALQDALIRASKAGRLRRIMSLDTQVQMRKYSGTPKSLPGTMSRFFSFARFEKATESPPGALTNM